MLFVSIRLVILVAFAGCGAALGDLSAAGVAVPHAAGSSSPAPPNGQSDTISPQPYSPPSSSTNKLTPDQDHYQGEAFLPTNINAMTFGSRDPKIRDGVFRIKNGATWQDLVIMTIGVLNVVLEVAVAEVLKEPSAITDGLLSLPPTLIKLAQMISVAYFVYDGSAYTVNHKAIIGILENSLVISTGLIVFTLNILPTLLHLGKGWNAVEDIVSYKYAAIAHGGFLTSNLVQLALQNWNPIMDFIHKISILGPALAKGRNLFSEKNQEEAKQRLKENNHGSDFRFMKVDPYLQKVMVQWARVEGFAQENIHLPTESGGYKLTETAVKKVTPLSSEDPVGTSALLFDLGGNIIPCFVLSLAAITPGAGNTKDIAVKWLNLLLTTIQLAIQLFSGVKGVQSNGFLLQLGPLDEIRPEVEAELTSIKGKYSRYVTDITLQAAQKQNRDYILRYVLYYATRTSEPWPSDKERKKFEKEIEDMSLAKQLYVYKGDDIVFYQSPLPRIAVAGTKRARSQISGTLQAEKDHILEMFVQLARLAPKHLPFLNKAIDRILKASGTKKFKGPPIPHQLLSQIFAHGKGI